MPNQQPIIMDVAGRRLFACTAAAVLVFIVNAEEKLLLLSHPQRKGEWEIVNGALDAEETILEGALRETSEEAGRQLQVLPLGTVHDYTIHYDDNVQYMISGVYLMAYQGGTVQPGNDMRGSQFRWWSLEELSEDSVKIIAPRDQKWLFGRAVELYRLWKDQEVDLQLQRDPIARTKYVL